MHEVVADLVADLVAVVVFTLGAAVMAGVGVLAEQAGVTSLSAGHVALGVWYVTVGTLALFVGLYLLGYREVAPRVRRLLARPD